MDEKLEKIAVIIREVLDQENLNITADFGPKDCEDWDSVAMVQIVLSVERAFGVRFEMGELSRIKSVGDLLKKL
jgi:acyl carrier protein